MSTYSDCHMDNYLLYRVFKKEKRPEEADRHKKREKYMNSKKPNRPDVTKTEPELTHNNSAKVMYVQEVLSIDKATLTI